MTGERRTNIQQQPTHTTIASFSATIYPTNTLCTLPHPPPLCYICHSPPFPTTMPPFHRRPLAKIHPTTLWPPQFTHYLIAPADLSQIFHNPPGNEPHPSLLRYHTLHTSHHLPFYISFLIFHNPAEPILSLKSTSHTHDPVPTSHISPPCIILC